MWIFLLILVLVGVLAAMLWYYHQQESVWQDELRGIHTPRNTSSAPVEKTKSTKIQPESIPEKKSTPKDTPVTPKHIYRQPERTRNPRKCHHIFTRIHIARIHPHYSSTENPNHY